MGERETELALIRSLAELVAWFGEESTGDYRARLDRAEGLLRKVAPDNLRHERGKVKVKAAAQ